MTRSSPPVTRSPRPSPRWKVGIEPLGQIGELSGSAGETLGSLLAAAETALEAFDAGWVPEVDLAAVDLGEGVVADIAEGVAGAGAAVAEGALQAAVDGVAAMVAEAIEMARGPIESIRDQALEVKRVPRLRGPTGSRGG